MAKKQDLKVSVSADTTKFQRQMAGLRGGIGAVGGASAAAGRGIGVAGGMAIGAVSRFALPAIAAAVGGAGLIQLARGLAPEFNKAWLELTQIAKDALVPAFDATGRFLRETGIPALKDFAATATQVAKDTAEGWDMIANEASVFWNRTLPGIVQQAQNATAVAAAPYAGDAAKAIVWGTYRYLEFMGADE
jgi:hypothetical protein